MAHRVEEIGGKYCVLVREGEHEYVFRYAYDDRMDAIATCAELERGYGRISPAHGMRANIETTLAFNYWRIPNYGRKWKLIELSYIRRTTQKKNWYVKGPLAYVAE